MVAPILDEIAEQFKGQLKVAKLDIDANPATPPRYGIRGIPTLMLFKNGEVAATKVGALSKAQLVSFLQQQNIWILFSFRIDSGWMGIFLSTFRATLFCWTTPCRHASLYTWICIQIYSYESCLVFLMESC